MRRSPLAPAPRLRQQANGLPSESARKAERLLPALAQSVSIGRMQRRGFFYASRGAVVPASILFVGLFLGPSAVPAWAAKVLECRDSQGNSTFADRCPRGTAPVSEQKLHVPVSLERDLTQIRKEHPIVLYSVPDCDACDLVRNYLNKHSLPFAEKSVETDAEVQEELKARTGRLSVPVVMVGQNLVNGYNRSVLESQLHNVGYFQEEEEESTPQ